MKMQETKLVDPHLLDPAQTGLAAQEFEARLRSKVVGQDDAIRQVVRVYQTFSLGMSIPGRPVGCFLFVGPTGTGKTLSVVKTPSRVESAVYAYVSRNVRSALGSTRERL